ncbi:putative molybdenum carrier protein [uncultured Draconibacterium sp.]|uniref:putative molybdenum carrier protein n=1 Tax=uncultured Draconibacterium sp. TaxID=1573823 RepID=UPI0025E66372|nr:putative molybdenum carrier protein [uncultured Draconibacterium sp.]
MTLGKLQIPCQKLISGGQTGVDRAILDACLANSFPCGGWCPKNRLAEDGTIPRKYPLTEMPETDYCYRTRQNVFDSDGTLILTPGQPKGGTLLTGDYARELKRPLKTIHPEMNPKHLSSWLICNNIQILHIAGPRESEWPEAYPKAYQLAVELIVQIKLYAIESRP